MYSQFDLARQMVSLAGKCLMLSHYYKLCYVNICNINSHHSQGYPYTLACVSNHLIHKHTSMWPSTSFRVQVRKWDYTEEVMLQCTCIRRRLWQLGTGQADYSSQSTPKEEIYKIIRIQLHRKEYNQLHKMMVRINKYSYIQQQ